MTIRTDLLALTDDAVAALTNRGLVKRARKELGRAVPDLSVDDSHTLSAVFGDGVRVTVATGGFDRATCTCAATTTCRHVVAAVLAYRDSESVAPQHESPGDGPTPGAQTAAPGWSPGSVDDSELITVYGTRAVAAAQRRRRAGYVATVRRPSGPEGVTSVDLPGCTVRFLVPGDLGYVDTDAAPAVRATQVVLAVWAVRQADATREPTHPQTADEVVEVHGDPTTADTSDSAADDTAPSAADSGLPPLRDAVDLADRILNDGVRQSAGMSTPRIAQVRERLENAGLQWPGAAVDELAHQLDAYQSGHAAYSPDRVAELIAEVHARHRAVAGGGRSLRTRVLGTEEHAEVPVGRIRLVGLGARSMLRRARRTGEQNVIASSDAQLVVDIHLADVRSGTVLVLRRTSDERTDALPSPEQIAGRRIINNRLADIATGTVIAPSAHRSAARMVRVGVGRVSPPTVVQAPEAWDELRAGVAVADFAQAHTAFAAAPPRLIRPRVAAENVRVLAVHEVIDIGYRPGAQELRADVVDVHGTVAGVVAVHAPEAPHRLDALAAALDGSHGSPDRISGAVRSSRGRLLIEPLAVRTATGLVVPDLIGGAGTELAFATAIATDPIDAALTAAAEVLAELAHTGLAHPLPTYGARIGRVVDDLRRVGLATTADALSAVASLRADAWVDAQIRVTTTVDAR